MVRRSLIALPLALAMLVLSQVAHASTALTEVQLDWFGNGELQGRPPFGGSNHFSAGVSEGSEASYAAQAGAVQIVQRAADGSTEYLATYASRAAHLTGSSNNGGRQIVRFSGGTGTLENDGSAQISWTGAFSVNFYGGLVPFTITNPVLQIDASGNGTLKGDLSGYGSDINNPTVKAPLTPSPNTTFATLSSVTLAATGTTSITPVYAGVTATTPPSAAPQLTSSPGWGAWPQPFLDFQFQTGLASLWYTSGGAFDAQKPPYAFTVTPQRPQSALPLPPSPPVTTTTTTTTATQTDQTPPAPSPKPASVTPRKGTIRLSATRSATVATIACPDLACTIATARSAKITVRGRRYTISVAAPAKLAAGRSGTVRISLPRAAAKRLGRGTVRVRLSVRVASGSGTPTTTPVSVKVRGRR